MIRVLRQDPLEVEAEAVLRSVGTDLEACTAVDRRLGEGAGLPVLERLRASGEVPLGGALVTPGGGLRTPLLIHAVVRSREEPVSEASVRRALENGLRQAEAWGVRTLVLPPLGTGAGNLDAETSARVMCALLRCHLASGVLPEEILIAVGSGYEEDAFAREAARSDGP